MEFEPQDTQLVVTFTGEDELEQSIARMALVQLLAPRERVYSCITTTGDIRGRLAEGVDWSSAEAYIQMSVKKRTEPKIVEICTGNYL